MTNYRNSKLVERYEDVVFELDKALITVVANDASQAKEGHLLLLIILEKPLLLIGIMRGLMSISNYRN